MCVRLTNPCFTLGNIYLVQQYQHLAYLKRQLQPPSFHFGDFDSKNDVFGAVVPDGREDSL
jgi:hypothetical protein